MNRPQEPNWGDAGIFMRALKKAVIPLPGESRPKCVCEYRPTNARSIIGIGYEL